MDEFQNMAQGAEDRVIGLTCAYGTNPLGVGLQAPRFGWKMQSARRGARQTAYRVIVADSAEALRRETNLLWDSGKVVSDQSIHVPYGGPELHSRQRAWWLVEIWNEQGRLIPSEAAWWEMGLLDRSDWDADWIGASIVGGPRTTAPAPYLRRSFWLEKPAVHARLYSTALGLYECSLNGRRVGEDVLTPGWTDYNKRVHYQVYDVTELLQEGENVIGAILGDGWYCGHVAWAGRQVYGDRPRLLARLEITYADGTQAAVRTGPEWTFSTGPILESDMQMGESYDARQEQPGWNRPDFQGEGWQPVLVFPDTSALLVAQSTPPVRRTVDIAPVADPVQRKVGNNMRRIFDLGQNMVGWVRFRGSAVAGTTVTLRFAEVLDADGNLYTVNLRGARATDVYTFRGDGEEVFEPHFTFHGFRYVEVTGMPGDLTRAAVTGIVTHSDLPVTGEFSCSDARLNQLQHNIQWGQRGNFLDVPTDCPQRDERLGWTGDAQVFARTAAFNMGVAPFFSKWLQDLVDAQSDLGQIPSVAPNVLGPSGADGGPAWADVMAILPWVMYRCYGDRALLERVYPNVRRYVEYLRETSVDDIRCHPDSIYPPGGWDGYGDWLSINAETPKDLIGTAFYAHSARLLSQMAQLIGVEDDRATYAHLSDTVRAAFQRRFVTQDGLLSSQSQTAYVLALHFDLLPEALRPAAAKELVRDIQRRGDRLSTGFVGAPYLMHVLSAAGRNDIAYRLLLQTSWPSWLYSVTQGATTIWERWDGWTHDKGFQDPGMNSFNHYAYGSIGDWLYHVTAGIDVAPDGPGYQRAVLKPQPGGGLTYVKAALDTLYGILRSAWRVEDGRFIWDVQIPPNTTALLAFPVSSGTEITLDGRPLEPGEYLHPHDDSAALWQAASGAYSFQMPAQAVFDEQE